MATNVVSFRVHLAEFFLVEQRQVLRLRARERMLELHTQLAVAKTVHAKTTIQRQIDATDAQIDKLVYELYGLSADEIKIVAGAA